MLIVVAQSARMLSQMAVDAGYVPLAIDCFADVDTWQLAREVVKVASLRIGDLKPALEALAKKYPIDYIVYGSGFEHCVDSLAYMESRWRVLGNPAALFEQFQDKRTFFGRLAILAIEYPQTVFNPPNDGGDWLCKPMRGEGGAGIKRFDENLAVNGEDVYWQRYLPGEAFSALFVAGCGRVKVLGFNRQWTVAENDDRPFIFAGIGNHAEISAPDRDKVSGWLAQLVEAYPLRGLGSVDFIVHQGQCYLLEINARVPASAQLYGSSMLALHSQACLGGWGDGETESVSPGAFQVIYAQKRAAIPEVMSWPQWVVDRPDGGAIIGKGQPICSIIAAGKNAAQVMVQLRRQENIIENFLKTGR